MRRRRWGMSRLSGDASAGADAITPAGTLGGLGGMALGVAPVARPRVACPGRRRPRLVPPGGGQPPRYHERLPRSDLGEVSRALHQALGERQDDRFGCAAYDRPVFEHDLAQVFRRLTLRKRTLMGFTQGNDGGWVGGRGTSGVCKKRVHVYRNVGWVSALCTPRFGGMCGIV